MTGKYITWTSSPPTSTANSRRPSTCANLKASSKPVKNTSSANCRKGLYGLKQAGRTWNQTIDPALKQLGLTPLDKDDCVYFHRDGKDMIIISLYVDDLFLFTSSTRLLKQFKEGLKSRFEMEDLGEAKLVLGMQDHTRQG